MTADRRPYVYPNILNGETVTLTREVTKGTYGNLAFATCALPGCEVATVVAEMPISFWPRELRRRGWTNSHGTQAWFCPDHKQG